MLQGTKVTRIPSTSFSQGLNFVFMFRPDFLFIPIVESTDLSTGKHPLVLAPWTPIAKPEDVVSDTLEGVLHYRIDDNDGDG